jgi:cytochrome c oxidase cbb3-type subunit IV
VLLLAFIGVVAWSWSRKRRPDFEEVARLPLEEDTGPPAVNRNKGQGA